MKMICDTCGTEFVYAPYLRDVRKDYTHHVDCPTCKNYGVIVDLKQFSKQGAETITAVCREE